MGEKNRELLANVKIESVAAEGKSVAHTNGKVLFVPYAIPGDIVDVQVRTKRRGYMEGHIVRMVKPSPDRVEPFCSHFGVCGGCRWQMLPYPLQLKFKEQQVYDQLTRIGKLSLPPLLPIIGSNKERGYRNKLEYTFSCKRWIASMSEAENLTQEERLGLGFHISGLFDKVLDIDKCYLQSEPSNEIRLFVKQYAVDNNLAFYDIRKQTGFLRNIIIRNTSAGEWMLTVVFAHEDEAKRRGLLDAVAEKFAQLTSLNYIINGKKNDSVSDLPCYNYYGDDAIHEFMEGLTFRIGPKSFYQANPEQAYRLYSTVRKFANLTGDETVYDLYTGTGTIALFLSSKAKKVIGIEYVPEAIADAKMNAVANNINNACFFSGDMRDIYTTEFIEAHGRPDIVVLDPPRAGVHPDVVAAILNSSPSRIVYVSCNPASQARDLAMMKNAYSIREVQPIDMFPHTFHIENVVLLHKI